MFHSATRLVMAAALSIAGFTALVGDARADIVTYTFTGTVQGNVQPFTSLFNIGDQGQYVLTFDTNATQSSPGSYPNAGIFMSLSVGNLVLATSNTTSAYFSPTIIQPYTTTGWTNAAILGYMPTQVQGNLWTGSGGNGVAAIPSNAIPTTAFSLAPFTYMHSVVANFANPNVVCAPFDFMCQFSGGMASGQFNMSLDTLVVTQGPVQQQSQNPDAVPAPGALALLGFGLLGLGGLRRKQKAA